MTRKTPIAYDFRTVNPSQYELRLTGRVKHGHMMRVISNHLIKSRVQNLRRVEIEPQFFKVMMSMMKGSINDVKRAVSVDDIQIVTCEMHRGTFEKKKGGGDEWELNLHLTGLYHQKGKEN